MSDLPHRHDRHEGTAHDAGEASHGTLPTDHGHSPDGDGTPGDPGHEHDHDHGHDHHPGGLRGLLADLLKPHSHDAADSVDDALAGSTEGIRAVKMSLIGLGATALFQLVVVIASGSVALLADTIHNFADASTAIPLWLAFSIGRRPPNRRYTYGYGRAEDLAGVFVVLMIAASAAVAAWESFQRLIHPQPITNLGWVAAAG